MTEGDRAGPWVVTGGAGAIGSVVVQELLARGGEVRVIDNLASGQRGNLPAPGSGRLSLTVADLKEPARYAAAFDGAHELWHLAANGDIRKGSEDPRLDLENGILATFAALEEARRHDVPRVIYSSSSVVYGFPTVLPTPESYGPLEPESLYAGAKLASEGLCSAFAHTYGLRVFLFRFANIVGPHMSRGVLFDLFEKLAKDPTRLEVLGDGRQAKSYLRTEDCVAGMLLLSERATEPVNIFNLGAADQISVREIAEKVVRAHGGTAKIEYAGGERGWVGDVPKQFLAIDRAVRLGWKPRWSSAEAIDRTIADLLRERGRGP